MPVLGSTDYRNGANERLAEAFVLLRQEYFGGSIYLAGRAVEGMFRAVIWKNDSQFAAGERSLETGHDLRAMLRRIENLGILRSHPLRHTIIAGIPRINRLWSNNMRYWLLAKVKGAWYDLGEIHGRRTLKFATQDFVNSCSFLVKECEELCRG